MSDPVSYNRDNKFDMQLSASMLAERRLGKIFETAKFEKIELKTETWQWRRTGNIAIEYRQRGARSGIAITEADYWVHELCDDHGKTMLYLVLPVPRLKELCREAYAAGHYRKGVGDGGEYDVILLSVSDLILRLAK